MVKVIVTEKLEKEIDRIFKKQSVEVFDLIYSLEDNPHKGKELGHVGNVLIKELKYENYRFYFITDGYKIKMAEETELADLLIKFIRMSGKNDQQKVIDEIKYILRKIGEEGFE